MTKQKAKKQMKFENKKHMALALLDGRKFYYSRNTGVSIYWSGEKFVHVYGDGSKHVIDFHGIGLDDWEEVKSWDEEIPDGGILCWVSDNDPSDESLISEIIVSKNMNDKYISKSLICWKYAKPLNIKELIQLTDNVPRDF